MGTVTYAKLVTEHLQQFGMDSNQAETVLQHMKAHSRHEAMRGRWDDEAVDDTHFLIHSAVAIAREWVASHQSGNKFLRAMFAE